MWCGRWHAMYMQRDVYEVIKFTQRGAYEDRGDMQCGADVSMQRICNAVVTRSLRTFTQRGAYGGSRIYAMQSGCQDATYKQCSGEVGTQRMRNAVHRRSSRTIMQRSED